MTQFATLEAAPEIDRYLGAQTDGAIRVIVFETDQDTGYKAILDITEWPISWVRSLVGPRTRRPVRIGQYEFAAAEVRAVIADFDRRVREDEEVFRRLGP